jgi:hypothetical protein
MSVSSLLKSAEATRNKVLAYEDSVAAFEWENSAQTRDDWVKYSGYLQARSSQATDPSKVITYQGKIRSAQRSFVSNEIQRASIDILYGRGSNVDKYNQMINLFYQAQETGDMNLAQNLVQQLGSLSQQIQNEQASAGRAAATMAKNQVKDINDFVKKVFQGSEPIQMADGSLVKPIALLDQELKTSGNSQFGYFNEALNTVESMFATLADAYQGLGTQEARAEFEKRYADYFPDEFGNPPKKQFTIGGTKMTYGELALAHQSELANNPIYSPVSVYNPVTRQTEFKLKENKVDDTVWAYLGQDEQGQDMYDLVQTRTKVVSPLQNMGMKIFTENGRQYVVDPETGKFAAGTRSLSKQEIDALPSLSDKLQERGIIVDGSGNEVTVRLPDGTTYEGATVMPDGTLRYVGQDGLVEVNPWTDNRDQTFRLVGYEETSDFGVASEFGGQLSKTTPTGQRLIEQLVGTRKSPSGLLGPNARITGSANDFSGFATPALAGNLQGTSSVLQGAANTRSVIQEQQKQMQLELQSQQQSMQSNVGLNLNQMPVRQNAQQLNVARPTAQPRITVQPIQQKKISNVTTATPGRVTGVSVAGPQPKLSVR